MITEMQKRMSAGYLGRPWTSVQLMLFSGCGLLFLGLLMSASTTISAAQHTTGNALWSQLLREVLYLAMGVPVLWVAVRMSPRRYRMLAYPALGLALFLLVAALVPGVGLQINGARRWIAFGPLTVQPSEFAKLAVLLWGADLLARKERWGTLDRARHVLVPLVPMVAVVVALVMVEPDLGTTLCFMLILLGLLWMVGLPLRYFGAIVLLVAGVVTYFAVTASYRLQRLTTFLHPNVDPGNAGYHTLQGLYALASGGFFGVGLGKSTSKYGWVPNANTDYVFAVVGEELGLLGALLVLVLFAVFTYSAVRIAHRAQDCFVRLAAGGAAVWIAGQALINIGYVTGLLPVTGIPLPFISNGGTSLILTCGVFGMLLSFARHEPEAVAAAARMQADGAAPRWSRRLRLGIPTPPAVRPGRPATARRTDTPRPAAERGGAGRPVGRAQADPARPDVDVRWDRPLTVVAEASPRVDGASGRSPQQAPRRRRTG